MGFSGLILRLHFPKGFIMRWDSQVGFIGGILMWDSQVEFSGGIYPQLTLSTGILKWDSRMGFSGEIHG